jgi:type IV pilus assembly protein PilZ
MDALYHAYMPWIKGGGLFIRTNPTYSLNDLVTLSVQLGTDSNPYLVKAKVAWITPLGAQGNKSAGIGVQFMGEDTRNLCRKIETLLTKIEHSDQPTDTM